MWLYYFDFNKLGVRYLDILCDFWSIRFMSLMASDESYLLINDSNRDAIDYLWEIVITILRESKHIIDNGSDIPLMLMYVDVVFVTEMWIFVLSILRLLDLLDLWMLGLVSELYWNRIWLEIGEHVRLVRIVDFTNM